MVVQELGWASEVAGTRPVGENHRERVDVVLLWWRARDGNLVGALRGVTTMLSAVGFPRIVDTEIAGPMVSLEGCSLCPVLGHIRPSTRSRRPIE